jgi:hypothetical protein
MFPEGTGQQIGRFGLPSPSVPLGQDHATASAPTTRAALAAHLHSWMARCREAAKKQRPAMSALSDFMGSQCIFGPSFVYPSVFVLRALAFVSDARHSRAQAARTCLSRVRSWAFACGVCVMFRGT